MRVLPGTCALCLPPPPKCARSVSWSKLTVSRQMQPWQPSAHGWQVLCQELRKQGRCWLWWWTSWNLLQGAGPHLSQGVGSRLWCSVRMSGSPCPRLVTRGPNKLCVDVHLNVGGVCVDAVVMGAQHKVF